MKSKALDQHLIKPEEPEVEDEIEEHKATFLNALKELEAARMYICQSVAKNNINVMCDKGENELYILRAQRQKKTKDWLKK
jgi:hypothetical protein